MLLWNAFDPASFTAYFAPFTDEAEIGFLVFTVATMVVFCYWIYVAGTDQIDLGYDDLEFTPTSRIWWYVVPIARLFKPFQDMRELWMPAMARCNMTGTRVDLGLVGAVARLRAAVICAGNGRRSERRRPWLDDRMGRCRSAVRLRGNCDRARPPRITDAQRRPNAPQLAEVFA